MRHILFAIVLATVAPAFATEPLLKPGDRVAIVGGTFVERMQSDGALEAEIQCRQPDWKLTFRNLGWSGDDVHGIARKRFDTPEDGYQRILSDVALVDPTVVIVAYGFSEASDGEPAVARFETGLQRLTGDLMKSGRRVILLSPIAMPGYRSPTYRESISECQSIVASIGAQIDAPVLSIDWQPGTDEVNFNGLLPNGAGYVKFADLVADGLVGGAPCESKSEMLTDLIVRKNELFFHRYRPQNETYLLLFRKHEQGNNAAELHDFDPLIRSTDEAIWAAAK